MCNVPPDPHCGQPPHCGFPPHCGQPPVDEPSSLLRVILGLILALLIVIFGKGGEAQPEPPVSEKPRPALRPLKVAVVSVFGTACGIATYNQYLLDELRLVADVHVFAEIDRNTLPDPSWVTRCWKRTEHPKARLLAEVRSWEPDVVLVGHEFGFWPRAYQFTQFVSELQRHGIKVVTAMHSVWAHLDKTVQESGSDALIVHSQAAALTLAHKGIGKNRATVIPHGTRVMAGTTEAPELLPPLWNTWDAPMLYTSGFALRYKGSLRLLDIVAKLKDRYPNIHLVIQASTNAHNHAEHEALFQEIDAKIAHLRLEPNVTLHKGFVPEEVMLAHIRTAKAVVLPYQTHPDHDVKGTSGIARHVVCTETPLVTSNVGLFSDLDGVAVKCDSDDDFVAEISRILNGDPDREARNSARVAFLRRTSWLRVAEKYMGVLSAVAER